MEKEKEQISYSAYDDSFNPSMILSDRPCCWYFSSLVSNYCISDLSLWRLVIYKINVKLYSVAVPVLHG